MERRDKTGIRVRLAAAAALGLALTLTGALVAAQGRGGPPAPTPTPRALEPENVDLSGYWVAIVNEDWRWRMVTPPPGDFGSLPLTDEGRKVGNQWTPAQDGSCKAYGMAGLMRMPTRLHITWVEDDVLQIETDAGSQTRRLYFNAAEAPRRPSPQGRSIAAWVSTSGGLGLPVIVGPGGASVGTAAAAPGAAAPGAAAPGAAAPGPPKPVPFGYLRVTTDSLTAGWLRRNGAPYSDRTTVEEHFENFESTDKSQWLAVTQIIKDPLYINGEHVVSPHFRREAGPDGPRPANWNPTPCRAG